MNHGRSENEMGWPTQAFQRLPISFRLLFLPVVPTPTLSPRSEDPVANSDLW